MSTSTASWWRSGHLLNARGVVVNERNVGKLYRQFLALLGGLNAPQQERLAASTARHGGVVWAVDALQPEGDGTLLYVLYDAVSGIPVSALTTTHARTAELCMWLSAVQDLPYPVLATLSDGDDAIGGALRTCWPAAPHQRCQVHFLNAIAAPVLKHDAQLRRHLQESLGDVGTPPETVRQAAVEAAPPFCPPRPMQSSSR